jgi:hypothetical protein
VHQPSRSIVAVRDGGSDVEACACRTVRMADGRRGAVYQGLAFPLQDDGSIDIAGEGTPPAALLPWTDDAGTPERTFAVIDGDEEAYVLVGGSVLDCQAHAAALQGAGVSVLRTGRYLGDPPEGAAADWFIRIVRPPGADGPGTLEAVLAPTLGMAAARSRDGGTPAEQRLRLLAAELEASRAREARLDAALAALARQAEGLTETQDALRELQTQLDEERRLRAAAEAALADLGSSTAAPAPAGGTVRAAGRIASEFASAVELLLPGVRLVRDGAAMVCAEFADRRGVYRALQSLPEPGARLDSPWKKIQGTKGWFERHMSTGQDDSGRIYARLDPDLRVWEVLLSRKSDQARDVELLIRREKGPN